MAALAVALGIAVCTLDFAIAWSVLLKPLPYLEPHRLVLIWNQRKEATELQRTSATPADLLMWREIDESFVDLAALEMWEGNRSAQVDLVFSDGAERLRGAFVTPNLFDLLGVRAEIGRTFSLSGADPDSVILSHDLWQTRFGGDPSIIGRDIRLLTGRDRRARRVQIVGVLPSDVPFTYPRETQIWLPLSWGEVQRGPQDALRYWVVGRLQRHVSVSAAQRHLATLTEEIGAQSQNQPFTVRIEPIQAYAFGQARPVVVLWSAIAGLVLLIASVNVACVLLARTNARVRELALRSALGAGRARLFRQLLVEGMLLVAIGGAAGVFLAFVMLRWLRQALPASVPRVGDITIDGWVLVVSLATILGAGIAANLVPGWRGTVLKLRDVLSAGTMQLTAGTAALRMRRTLITGQTAVLCALLVSAALLLQSLWKLRHVDLGFDGARVLTMEMRLMGERYREPTRLALFQEELLRRVRALQGVEQASLTSSIPFRGTDWMRIIRTTEDRPVLVNLRQVDSQYFSLMRIPLRAGRLFSTSDSSASEPVAILSESLARRLFPDEDPIGKRIPGEESLTVIGVVGDVRHERPDEVASPAYYVPRTQDPSELVCLVIRTSGAGVDIGARVQGIVGDLDPEQPVRGITTIDRVVSDAMADRHLATQAASLLGIVALALTIIGFYAMMSQTVVERMRESAVRVAMGARGDQVLKLLLKEALKPVAAGLVVGAVVAFAMSGLLQTFLFGVEAAEPVVYLSVFALVGVTALAACYVPARRATQLDPQVLLRQE